MTKHLSEDKFNAASDSKDLRFDLQGEQKLLLMGFYIRNFSAATTEQFICSMAATQS